MKKYAIIVAAGLGSRMEHALPKQFLLLLDKPILLYTLNAFLEVYADIEIILVLPAEFLAKGEDIIRLTESPERVRVISGGETRFHSVKNALPYITTESIVFVHDGVRCLVSKELIQRCYLLASEKGNAVPSVSVTDSIRVQESDGNKPIDRDALRIIQTPQTFRAGILKKGFEQEYRHSFTDEATVVEQLGVEINLVEGENTNLKITRPIDLVIAAEILKGRTGPGKKE